MNLPVKPNDSSDGSIPKDVGKLVNLWFAVAVIGLFVFACFYILKVAVDLLQFPPQTTDFAFSNAMLMTMRYFTYGKANMLY